jgi:Leucine-rich repeat (LRR) protein
MCFSIRACVRAAFVLSLAASVLYGQPTIATRVPNRNANTASLNTSIVTAFSQNMNAGTASANAFKVFGSQTGYRSAAGTFTGGGTSVINFAPTKPFKPGELVSVSAIGSNVQNTSAVPMGPSQVWQFRTRTGAGPSTAFSVPSAPGSASFMVMLGDLDSDGDLDMIQCGAGAVSVSLNDGIGNYTLAGSPYLGADGPAILGDVDNDGDLDMVIVDSAPGNFYIRLNNGAGIFGSAIGLGNASLPFPVYPVPCFGDVNGDGYLDIVASNNLNGAPGQLSVFLNTGAGTFGSPVNYSIIGSLLSNSIALGDVDGDGDLDAVTANLFSTNISVMINNGVGGFPTGAAFPTTGADPTSLDLGDVDGDGDIDVAVVAQSGTLNTDVLLNNGTGNFSTSAPGSPFSLPSPNNAAYLALLADMDGDGDLDLVSGGCGANNVSVRLNNGAGNFNTSPAGSPFPVGIGPFGLAVGDIDGDGDIDVITANAGAGSSSSTLKNGYKPVLTSITPVVNTNTAPSATAIRLVYNQTMTTATATTPVFKIWGGMTGLRTGTYTGGGTTMPVFTPSSPFRSGEQVWVTVTNAQTSLVGSVGIPARPFVYGFRAKAGVGPARFADQSTGSPFSVTSFDPIATVAADVDNDGDADLITANYGAPTITVLKNNGSGAYAAQTFPALGGSPRGIDAGDIDNDGDVDVVVANEGGFVAVLLNTGSGIYGSPISSGISDAKSIVLADFNADGYLDIGAITSSTVYIALNNGAGGFGLPMSFPLSLSSALGMAAGDVDGDGDIDIAITDESANTVTVVLNDGMANFTAAPNSPFSTGGMNPNNIALGDLDGDGDLDIVAGNDNSNSNNIAVLRNNGTGNFSAPTLYPVGDRPRAITLGDVDGDGDLDVAVGNCGTTVSVSVLLNSGSGTFSTQAAGSPFTANVVNPNSLVFADVDGDGDLDLCIANKNTNDVVVVLNASVPVLTGFTPARNTNAAGTNTAITFTYDQAMKPVTASEQSFKVWGQSTGYRSKAGTFTQPSPQQAQFTPARPFRAGELVWVTSTNAQSISGIAPRPLAYGFRTKPTLGTGNFLEVARANGAGTSVKPLTGDFNGDGAVDVVTADGSAISLWLNPGTSLLPSAPSQILTISGSFNGSTVQCLYATDVNNDGLLDLLFTTGNGSLGLCLNGGGSLGGASVLVGGSQMMMMMPTRKGKTDDGQLAATLPASWVDGADFNADGWQDLVVCINSPTYAAFMLLNYGNGSFSSLPSPLSGSFTMPVQSIVGDFDNDGDIDVGIVDKGTGSIQLFANNNLGYSFTPAATIPFANAARAFVADFTSDGKLDIAATSDDPNSRLVVFGNGSTSLAMSFGGGSTQSIGGNAIDLTGGDFNADGLMDVLVSGLPHRQRQIYLNNGSGGLIVQPKARGSAAQSTVADMDGDGAMDLVVTNADGSVSIEKNSQIFEINTLAPANGSVAASRSAAITQAYSMTPANVVASTSRIRAFGSMTGLLGGAFTLTGNQVSLQPSSALRPNEHVTVTVTNAQSSTLVSATRATVYSFRAPSGVGPAKLQLTTSVPTGGTPRALCAADFNRDGLADIALANTTANTVTVLTNTGGRLLGGATLVASSPQALCAADVDADGGADLLVAGQVGTSAALMLFRGGGGSAVTTMSPVSGSASGLWAGDVNGDGALDVVMTSESANSVAVFLNNGSGGFIAAHTFLVAAPRLVCGGDVDNDGDLDLVIAGSGGVAVWANMLVNATAAPAPFIQMFTLSAAGATALACVDVNSDGNVDVVAGAGTSGRTFLGNGKGSFSGGGTTSLGVANTAGVLQTDIGDMNGDGVLDFVSLDRTANMNSIAVAGASLITSTTTTLTLSPIALVLADMDNDGDLDAVTANQAGSATLFLNQEPPSITTFSPAGGFEGTTVTITGLYFAGVQSVAFGGIPARSFVVNSPTSITAVVGTRASGPITVANGSVAVQSSQTFTIIERLAIESFSPQYVTTGTVVTVVGTRLNEVTNVQLGALAASNFGIVNATTLTFTVPTNAVSAAISLASPSGGVSSSTAVIVVQPPTITSVSPRTTGVGFQVTLTGTNFVGLTNVSIGDVSVSNLTVPSSTRLVLTVPAGALSGLVRVTNIAGTAVSDSVLTILPPPIITALANDSTLTVLTTPNTDGTVTMTTVATVQISGANFTGATSVTIGGSAVASFAVLSDGLIVAQVRPSVMGVVMVVTPSGVAQSSLPFVFTPSMVTIPSPVITSFSPLGGGAGLRVVISGRNLTDVQAVRIAGVPVVSFLQISSTQVECVVPTVATVTTSGTIEITTRGGVARSQRDFLFTTDGTIVLTPLITAFAPALGSTGSTVTIVGENFSNVVAVRFGGVAVQSFTMSSTNLITAVVSTGATGLIEVETSAGRAASDTPFTFVNAMSTQTRLNQDSIALVQFYLANNGSAWRFKNTPTRWLTTAALETWEGVTVEQFGGEPRVVVLALPERGIEGRLIDALGELDALRILNLAGNRFTGGLGAWIGNLFRLQELRLTGSTDASVGLQGRLPDELGGLTLLRVLDVGNNRFSGALPESLCTLTELRECSIANNRFTGSLPKCLTTLANMEVLNLSANQFTGQIPQDFAKILSLREFRAARNQLTGAVPPFGTTSATVRLAAKPTTSDGVVSAESLSALQILDLSQNNLGGTIPATLGNLPLLSTLRLNNNQLTGQIPSDIWGARSLTLVYLNANQLTGSIPEPAGRAQLLQVLVLDSNKLTGRIPAGVTNMTSLRSLSLVANKMTFVPDLTRLGRLDTLRVQDNALTFESLEPNRAVAVFSYIRQDSVGAGGERVGYLGKRLVIDGAVGGVSNRYRWFKRTWIRVDMPSGEAYRLQEEVLPSQTQSRLVIEEFAATDTADGYYCRITNPTTPDLTLSMRPVRVAPAVIPPAPKDAPMLTFPTRSMTNIPLFAAFEWELVGDENRYEMQIARDSAFASVVAQSTVRTLISTTVASTSVQGLANGTQYWWRVRAVNLGGVGPWSEATATPTGRPPHRSFVTIPNNQALAFPLVDFGRVTVTRTGRAYARVTNVTDAVLRLEAALPQEAENSFANAEDSARTFAPRETKFLSFAFAPRTVGQKQGAATLRYRVLNASGTAGDVQTQPVPSAFTGRSGPLDVSAVDFQDMLVGRTAIATARVINRGPQAVTLRRATIATQEAAKILGLRTSSQGLISAEQLETQGVVLGQFGSGSDTTAIIVQGAPNDIRRLSDGLIVVADVDSAQSEVLGNVRQQTAQDVVISVGIRPSAASASNVAPGQAVTLELYLRSANATQLRLAAQPEFVATVRFSGKVLALDTRGDAYLVRNAGGTFMRAVLPAQWDVRDTVVLGRIQCMAVQGDTDRTELQIESLAWGARSAAASVGLIQQRVFVDSLIQGTFSSELCKAGGKRLVRQTTKSFLAAVQPNPTDDVTLLHYALRESGNVTLTLVDAKGSVVKTLLSGLHQAGEYELSANLGDVSQGAYMLILTTPTEILHGRISVVR